MSGGDFSIYPSTPIGSLRWRVRSFLTRLFRRGL